MAAVLVERRGELALVALNRPERLNAINADLRRELPLALDALERDAGVKAIVLRGAGERAFSAGQDLNEAAGYGIDDVEPWFRAQHAMFAALRACNKPTVAALVGVAAGAAYQLALYCDLRVAHAELRIGQPEVNTGLGSIMGTSQMTWHLPLSVNAELSLGAELIGGERAHALGLVNVLVAKDLVVEEALALARKLAARPPHAYQLTKERLRELTQAAFEELLPATIRFQRRAYESGEPQRHMKRLLERKKP
ncbi:MAG TPA: enoyl-CoA hydratase/isomerase family protein [Burkholderiales bacterium]|nr:enoyl-CoA hydratase/isomerase family protein [Burkholderiales bacterium]